MRGVRGILKCLVPCIRHHSQNPAEGCEKKKKKICKRETCREVRDQNEDLLKQIEDIERRVEEIRKHCESQIAMERRWHCMEVQELDMELKNVRQEMEVLRRYKSALAAERRLHYMEVQKLAMELENVRQKMAKKSPPPEGDNILEEPGEGIEGEECGKKWRGQYKAIKVLGRGGFGKVLLAKRKSAGGPGCNQEVVAIKVVAKEDDRDLVEKEVLMRAVGHPFLVQLLSFFRTERSLYYVMEYLEGGDMVCFLIRCGPLPEEAARFCVAEIILAVEFLHKYGIVHRDIKLENILLNRDGHCKLADFGASQRGIFNGIKARTVIGTIGYLAPEMVQRLSYGPEVDWWSVGVVMYVLMMGYLPFDLATFHYDVLHYPMRYPWGLSRNATSILRMFLIKDPAGRLGANGDTAAIQEHPFFETTDWEALIERRVEPPFKQLIEEVATMDPGQKTEEISGRASFETTDGGGMADNGTELQEDLVESPLLRRTTQFATMDPGEETEQDTSGRASFETADGGGMLVNQQELQEEFIESPLRRRTTQICVPVIILLLLVNVCCFSYLFFSI